MISDKQLREAACQAEKNLLASLPEPENCKAVFSPGFRRKMQKLVHRTDHPIRYLVQKVVACFLLVILLGGGSLLIFSAEAKATFVGWVREVYEIWFVYKYEGEANELPQDVVYRPRWVPDEYTEWKQTMSDDMVSIIYKDNTGAFMSFVYTRNRESVSLYSENTETVLQTVLVGNECADLYLDQRKGNANSLIWTDKEKGVIFLISAHCTGEELIKVAESIVEQQ